MLQKRCPHQAIECGCKLASTSDGRDRHGAFGSMGVLEVALCGGKGKTSLAKSGNDRLPQKSKRE